MGFLDGINNAVHSVGHTFSNLGKGINSGIRSVGSGLGSGLKSLGSGIGTVFKDIGDAGKGIVSTVMGMYNKMGNLLSSPMFLIVAGIVGVVVLMMVMK